MNHPDFFAHAVRLEAEAARISERLAIICMNRGEVSSEGFYREMAANSRKHLAEVLARSGYRDVSELPTDGYHWPDGTPPECFQWGSVHDIVDLDRAMALALEAEKRSESFYLHAAKNAGDANIREVAAQFAAEERRHVMALERIMGLRPY